MIDLLKGIVLVVGGYYGIVFLRLGYTIAQMPKEDYQRLQIACRTKEGWKNFWKYYER